MQGFRGTLYSEVAGELYYAEVCRAQRSEWQTSNPGLSTLHFGDSGCSTRGHTPVTSVLAIRHFSFKESLKRSTLKHSSCNQRDCTLAGDKTDRQTVGQNRDPGTDPTNTVN